MDHSQPKAQLLWKPGRFGVTLMDNFREQVNEKYRLKLTTYSELYEWSVAEYPQFWAEFWLFAGITYSEPYEKVVEEMRMEEIPSWFLGSRLNYAQNVLEKGGTDKVALYVAGEVHEIVKKVTFGQLKGRVKMYAEALRVVGLTVGDRVVGYLPNGQEAVEAYLASAANGLIWSSTSPDFGVSAVLDRFQQIQPKVLFSVDAVKYNGKRHTLLDKLKQVVDSMSGLECIVVIPMLSEEDDPIGSQAMANFIKCTPRSMSLEHFLALGSKSADICSNGHIDYVQVPFNHPLCILYSSGTTGPPKCMVHSVGGTLIQHLKEHLLHGNTHDKDILIYYTTTGWMMYNWMVSALATGASIVLYEGSPFHPSPTVMWDLVDEIGITIFGTSAKWLSALEQKGMKPRETHKLSHLHTILSTGSPLKPQSYLYVYNDIKKDVMLGSISGGSDIISCFVGQNPTVPVYEGEVQSRNLGMAVECWDEQGTPVEGLTGELVCTKAFPCMPVYFWNDKDGAKYRSAYFTRFKGVWSHGDVIVINPTTGGIVMLGRSDGTLNPNGVRFGSAEIYNVVEAIDRVADSLCVSQYSSSGEERVVLFLKMIDGHQLDQDVVAEVTTSIRNTLTVRHVPAVILQIEDIPYTVNGKKVEIAVKKIISGKDAVYEGSLINPQALELFKNIPQLQGY